MKRNIFVYSALSMALLATFSCSDDTTLADIERGNLGTIDFAPTLNNGGVVTRAHDNAVALNMNYTVWLENNGNGNLKKSSVATYASSAYTFSPVLFWDDISADKGTSTSESDVRKGATVKVWAAQFAGNTTPTVSDTHTFTWTVDAAQASNGIEKNDLLVADYIAAQKAIDNSVKQTIPLCFHHAMTKITINVIQGDGFATNEISSTTTTVTLKAQNTKATIDLSKAVGDGTDAGMVTVEATTESTSNVKDITMKAASTSYSYIVGKETKTAAASFDAIVVEGKALVATSGSATDFAEIKIKSATDASAYNTYKVAITDAILTAWKLSGKDNTNTLKHGVHYILNVTVKKQGIELTAVLAPWKDYTASANGAITFTGTNTDITGGTEAFVKPFKIYSKTTTSDANYTEGKEFCWKKTDNNIGYYDYKNANDTMYWADNNDKRYFRTALYESAKSETKTTEGQSESVNHTLAQATLTSNNTKVENIEAAAYDASKDLIWGTSGETAINPTTSAVKLLFQHALAKVTIKLATSADASAIDLKNVAKVEITGTNTKGGILDFDKGTISIAEGTTAAALEFDNKTTSTDENTKVEYTESKPYLVLPQTFATNTTENTKLAPKVVITMTDNSTYSVSLAEIHKALKKDSTEAGQTSDQGWKQGETYEYTITITKAKIEFAAVLKDWVGYTGSGNATMDWD